MKHAHQKVDDTLAGPGLEDESVGPAGSPLEALDGGGDSPVEDSTVELEHSLHIKDVEAVHRRLAAALDGGTKVTVDLSRLGSTDTAGVQLLLSFQSEARKRGVGFEFRAASEALDQALIVLGLSGVFEASSP